MLSKIGQRIYKLMQAVEEPSTFSIKAQGGSPTTYHALNKAWFKELNIDTVLDIGANTGGFAKTISPILPNANIYSFEPLPDCFIQLEKYSKKNPNTKAFNMGIGDKTGVLPFEKNHYSASSSFLKMTEAHKNAFPYTKESNIMEVSISKLDDVASSLNIGDSMFVKIDVQGYEDRVLKGGESTIKKAKLVMIETSFLHLYDSQPLFDDVYSVMRDWGFNYLGSLHQLEDNKTGRILQCDSLFQKA